MAASRKRGSFPWTASSSAEGEADEAPGAAGRVLAEPEVPREPEGRGLGPWVSLPIGFQIGKVLPVVGQAMRFALNPQWNLADIPGANKRKIVFTVTVLAPAK